MAVLGETLDRLNYLSYVPSQPAWMIIEELQESGSSDISGMLQKQWQLEEGNQVVDDVRGDKKPDFEKQVHASTRTLCRALRSKTNAVETLVHSSTQERSPAFLACVKALSELTKVTFDKLSTTVEDETSQKTILRDVSDREKNAEEERSTLQGALDMERKDKERNCAQLEKKLQKLKNELREISENTKVEEKLIEQEQNERMEKANEEHTGKVATLTSKIDKLTKETKDSADQNHTDEQALRKKTNKHVQEVVGCVEKYDTDMGERETRAVDLEELFGKEKIKLKELEEHFNKVDAENSRISEEKRILDEIKAKEDHAQKILGDAATMIQKQMRRYLAEKEFKKLKKAKGKKGKKGKKKK